MHKWLRNMFLMALMTAAAVVAPMLRPTTSLADQRPRVDLQTLVPLQFGEWQAQTGLALQLVDPDQKASLDRLYSDTLARVYVNREGYHIMLSVAYGKDQSDALQVHKPEVCYPAQGFRLDNVQRVQLDLPKRAVAATRLVTQRNQRIEPVTYWVVLGDQTTHGGVKKKILEMRYTLLQSTMPDGMLVRISSVDRDPAQAFAMHASFAASLVGALAAESRARFAGQEL